MSKQYPKMAFDPKEWIDNQIREFKTPQVELVEMLNAMRGSRVPDQWIHEALTSLCDA